MLAITSLTSADSYFVIMAVYITLVSRAISRTEIPGAAGAVYAIIIVTGGVRLF